MNLIKLFITVYAKCYLYTICDTIMAHQFNMTWVYVQYSIGCKNGIVNQNLCYYINAVGFFNER